MTVRSLQDPLEAVRLAELALEFAAASEVGVLREVLNLVVQELQEVVVDQADAGCKDQAVWQVAR